MDGVEEQRKAELLFAYKKAGKKKEEEEERSLVEWLACHGERRVGSISLKIGVFKLNY